jgi:hypothetical protein
MSSWTTLHFPVFHGEPQVPQEQLRALKQMLCDLEKNCSFKKRKIYQKYPYHDMSAKDIE